MPKVSVILSSYNHGKYIAASIESVLNQTFSDFELLIFDDGSSDNSQEIIRSFSDDRIKLFLYEKNRGSYHATQEALKSARGKYLALQHSDDIWESTKLEKQVRFLEENLDYAVCFTQASFIDENGELYNLPENHSYYNIFRQKNRSREKWLNQLFWNLNCFCNPSALIRNDFEDLYMNPCLFQLPDYFMWLNVCKTKNVYVLEEELINFRLRRQEQSSVSSFGLEKSIRVSNEAYFTAREFFSLTKDRKEFLKVFPEAQEFYIDGKIVTEFAFAQLCLRHSLPGFQKFGLEILYELLHNSNKAAELKKMYDYDEKNFIRETGRYDVFGVKIQTPILNSQLYIEFGRGFNEEDSIKVPTLVRPDGTFFVKFHCSLEKPIEILRFDPDYNSVMTVKLLKILVNGTPVKIHSSNALKVVDGYHYFFDSDPWFHLLYPVNPPELILEILGVIQMDALSNFNVVYGFAEKKIRRQEESLSRQTKLINTQQALNIKQDEQLDKQKEIIIHQSEKICQLEKIIAKQAGKIQQQEELITNQTKTIEQKDGAFCVLQEKNSSLELDLKQSHTEFEKSNAELEKANSEVGRLNSELEKSNSELEKSNLEVERLNYELEKLNTGKIAKVFHFVRKLLHEE